MLSVLLCLGLAFPAQPLPQDDRAQEMAGLAEAEATLELLRTRLAEEPKYWEQEGKDRLKELEVEYRALVESDASPEKKAKMRAELEDKIALARAAKPGPEGLNRIRVLNVKYIELQDRIEDLEEEVVARRARLRAHEVKQPVPSDEDKALHVRYQQAQERFEETRRALDEHEERVVELAAHFGPVSREAIENRAQTRRSRIELLQGAERRIAEKMAQLEETRAKLEGGSDVPIPQLKKMMQLLKEEVAGEEEYLQQRMRELEQDEAWLAQAREVLLERSRAERELELARARYERAVVALLDVEDEINRR